MGQSYVFLVFMIEDGVKNSGKIFGVKNSKDDLNSKIFDNFFLVMIILPY